MFILKLAGKILLLPVWLILFVIGLAVKMTVLLESGRIDHSESDRNSQFELNRNSQCTLAN